MGKGFGVPSQTNNSSYWTLTSAEARIKKNFLKKALKNGEFPFPKNPTPAELKALASIFMHMRHDLDGKEMAENTISAIVRKASADCLTPLDEDTPPEQLHTFLESPDLKAREALLANLKGYVVHQEVEAMRKATLTTLEGLRKSLDVPCQSSPKIAPSPLADYTLSEEDTALLHKDMPKIWDDAYARVLILLHIAKNHADTFSALHQQKNALVFTPDTIDAAFEKTQSPTLHQYVLAATLTLIQNGDLPALGTFVSLEERTAQELQQNILTHTNNQTNQTGTTQPSLNTATASEEGSTTPWWAQPLNQRYKVPQGYYSVYEITFGVLRSPSEHNLDQEDIEILVGASTVCKKEILEIIAPWANNPKAWRNDTLQPLPVEGTRPTGGEIAKFISNACVLLGLKSTQEQQEFAAAVASHMGYKKGHTFKEDDPTYVQLNHLKALRRFLEKSNLELLWQGGAVPNFTQTTVEVLFSQLFDHNGQPLNHNTGNTRSAMGEPFTWEELVELLEYSPNTINRYTKNPDFDQMLGAVYSARLAEAIQYYESNNVLTTEQIKDLYDTVYCNNHFGL